MFDEAAIAGLYQRYGHALFRRIKSLVASEADARELLQETFCQFVKNQGRFEGKSTPFTYLYRIATNLSIDRLRRRTTAGDQQSFEETGASGTQAQVMVGSRSAERTVAAAEELARLCEGLDSETLTVAVMSYVDGLTQDEIAAALDLSRRTIGKKLARFLSVTRERAGVVLKKDEAHDD